MAKRKIEIDLVEEEVIDTVSTIENVEFYDEKEIVVPQELAEKVETLLNPIVRILQKTPSSFNVLRADGTREKLTKAQYRAEVG